LTECRNTIYKVTEMSDQKIEATYFITCVGCAQEVNLVSKDCIKESPFFERLICGYCNSRSPIVEFLSEAQDRWQQEQLKRDEEMVEEEAEAIERAARWDPKRNYDSSVQHQWGDNDADLNSGSSARSRSELSPLNWDSEENEWTSDNGDYGK